MKTAKTAKTTKATTKPAKAKKGFSNSNLVPSAKGGNNLIAMLVAELSKPENLNKTMVTPRQAESLIGINGDGKKVRTAYRRSNMSTTHSRLPVKANGEIIELTVEEQKVEANWKQGDFILYAHRQANGGTLIALADHNTNLDESIR